MPLPYFVAEEQEANARFLADAGAGVMVTQLETTRRRWRVARLVYARKLLAMAAAARALGQARRHCALREHLHGAGRMKHKVKQLHFVGIGGSGMSGIARC